MNFRHNDDLWDYYALPRPMVIPKSIPVPDEYYIEENLPGPSSSRPNPMETFTLRHVPKKIIPLLSLDDLDEAISKIALDCYEMTRTNPQALSVYYGEYKVIEHPLGSIILHVDVLKFLENFSDEFYEDILQCGVLFALHCHSPLIDMDHIEATLSSFGMHTCANILSLSREKVPVRTRFSTHKALVFKVRPRWNYR